jgi:hypothetical protein
MPKSFGWPAKQAVVAFTALVWRASGLKLQFHRSFLQKSLPAEKAG